MVQIAANMALKTVTPKFNKKKFEIAVQYALTLTENHEEFYPQLHKAFLDAGVVFIILPNISGSKTNGIPIPFGLHFSMRLDILLMAIMEFHSRKKLENKN